MTCLVCAGDVPTEHEHHVVPRSAGGDDGPTVMLCANCHNLVHSAARCMQRGKSPDRLTSHLGEEGRRWALVLARVVVASELEREDGNPHPLLTVRLQDPRYMRALDRLTRDRGFSSREGLVNALAREIAKAYGLL